MRAVPDADGNSMTETGPSDTGTNGANSPVDFRAERLRLANVLSDLAGSLAMAEPLAKIGPRLTEAIAAIERYSQALQQSEAALGQSLKRLEAISEQHSPTIERLGLHEMLALFRQQTAALTRLDKAPIVNGVCDLIEHAARRDSAWQETQTKLADAVTNMQYDVIADLGRQAEEAKATRDRAVADLGSMIGDGRNGSAPAAVHSPQPALSTAAE